MGVMVSVFDDPKRMEEHPSVQGLCRLFYDQYFRIRRREATTLDEGRPRILISKRMESFETEISCQVEAAGSTFRACFKIDNIVLTRDEASAEAALVNAVSESLNSLGASIFESEWRGLLYEPAKEPPIEYLHPYDPSREVPADPFWDYEEFKLSASKYPDNPVREPKPRSKPRPEPETERAADFGAW